jgi:hypothetical protein
MPIYFSLLPFSWLQPFLLPVSFLLSQPWQVSPSGTMLARVLILLSGQHQLRAWEEALPVEDWLSFPLPTL